MTREQAEKIRTTSYRLTSIGVHLTNGDGEIMICGPLDVVSRIRINMPAALPQSWMTLSFQDIADQPKQILIQDSALDDEHYWAMLGDLDQEKFYVHRGYEEFVRDYLRKRLACTPEFELRHTIPVHSVYLGRDRPGRRSLYEELVSDPVLLN